MLNEIKPDRLLEALILKQNLQYFKIHDAKAKSLEKNLNLEKKSEAIKRVQKKRKGIDEGLIKASLETESAGDLRTIK